MPSLGAYQLTWVSLTLDVGYLLPWMWGISSQLLQQSYIILYPYYFLWI